MSTTDGAVWLRSYVENGSGDAFAKIVASHFDLVYSAALRRVAGDAHLAQDVAQTVFTDLARKAKSLSRDVYLAGWLYRHTCFTASKTVRGERRRQNRERQAVEMNAQNDSTDAVWKQLAPALEEAMKELADADRDAILLRFFERQPFRVVGDTLGVGEDGARKRVERALEKLRAYFGSRGVTVSAVALGEVLTAQAVTTAPAGAAASVASAALAGAAIGGTTTIIKFIVMTKLKIAGTAALAGMAAIIAYEASSNGSLREQNRALAEQAAQVDALRAENEQLSKRTNAAPLANDDQLKELLRLRAQVSGLNRELSEAQRAAEKNARLAEAQAQRAAQQPQPEQDDPQKQLAIAKMNFLRQAVLMEIMFAQDNQSHFPTGFDQIMPYGATNLINTTNNLSLDQFEMVYQGKVSDATNPAETIAVREKQPMELPDGGWVKAYGFVDGHCEIHKAQDGNFEPWESKHMQQPPAQ